MGRGTNYVKKPTTLDAVSAARRLHLHTHTILKNENVFKPERDYLTRSLITIADLTVDTLSKAYHANEIFVGDNPALARERLTLQSLAIASCRTLLDWQGTAKVQFSLRDSKYRHWVKLASETLAKLRAWHEGDNRRYGAIARKEDLPTPQGGGERVVG